MEIAWNFPDNNNGEIVGIGEAGIETFRGSLFSSLAREICQNSLDARVDYKQPVKVEFVLENIAKNKIPGINELSEAVNLCKEYWKSNEKTVKFFDNAIKVCKADKIRVLRISDYNTTGLTGSDKAKLSPWQDLVKSSGVSNKSGESGGSYGIGKSAPFACSELRTIFYNTLDKDGLKAYQGVAKLVSFQYDKKKLFATKKTEVTQGKGYYGIKENNSAVKALLSFDSYLRNKVGTDVYIIGFVRQEEWVDEIIKAIIDGYLISILQGDLEVEVGKILINTANINELVEKYKEELPLAYNYYEVLKNETTEKIEEDFEGLGKLKLYVLIKKDFRRKVLMARNNGMKIFDKQNISSTVQFAGVCILEDKKLNEFFREMENPQHNNWESDRHSNKKEAERLKKKLFKFIKDTVLEIGKSSISDEMDAVGAGEFIPDLDMAEQESDNRKEDISSEVKVFSAPEKVSAIKTDKGAWSDFDKGIESEETYEEEQGEYKDFDNSYEDVENEEGIKGAAGSLDIDDMNYEEEKSTYKKTVMISPLKLRIFMYNNEEKVYKLIFIPENSAKDAYIEIVATGEQNNTALTIKSAKTAERKPLNYGKNRIYIGNIKGGKKYSFLYSIKYNELCSMGVLIYGYKI